MQSLSDTVLVLNTNAASLLLDGCFHEADALFHQALQHYTSSITPCTPPAAEESAENHASSPTTKRSSSFAINVAPAPVNKQISTLQESFSPDNIFVLYDKCFLVGVVASNEVDATTCAWKLQLSAILLYNWGIANHCVAISTGSTTHMQRAFKIYSRAFAVLTPQRRGERDADTDMKFNDATTLLLLALYNNMGHCCSHLSMPESAQKCHEHLQSIAGIAKRSQVGFTSEYEIFENSNLVFLNQGRSSLHFAAAA
jgi:hypothetical protein